MRSMTPAPTAARSLSEGDLIGKEITCPLHGAIFDVTTGEVLEGPAGEGVTCLRGSPVGRRHRGQDLKARRVVPLV